MGAAASSITIRHDHHIHAVETTQDADQPRPAGYTMLELVEAIGEVTDDENEIVATVIHMLRTGRVRLTGNFRDRPIEEICNV